jgi:hypothetical protein
MAERASINQRVQVGVETTSGTAAAANKLLESFKFVFGIEAEVAYFRATGRKYPAEQEEQQEWSSGSMDGNMDYNGLVYPLSGIAGAATISASASSATAKQWLFVPPITGNTTVKTFTFEQGDAVRAHKIAYGLFTQWGYKLTRKEFTTSGTLMGQLLSDGITLTSSPTGITLAPMVGKQVNVYLDTTSAGLGTTQLTRVISAEYTFDNVYGPAWFLNRATPSFTTHIDMEPKCTFKIMVEADSAGMALLGYLQSGTTYYVRVDALGALIASDGGTGTDPVYQSFKHDMALKFGKPSAFSDSDGIFAIEWEATVVEDLGWSSGTAQKFTLVNLLTAL